jgi:carboxyl-terminal processing protease
MKKLIIILLLFGLIAPSLKAQSYDTLKADTKFSALLHLIDKFYMDSCEIPRLTEAAIRAMLKELDPHSVYIPKEDVNKMNEQLAGSFEGVGITYQIFRDTILVIAPHPEGPSEKAGILAGDKIVRIDNEDAVGKKVDEAFIFERLRGKKGTEVTLEIVRYGIDSLLKYKVVRDKIPMNSISASFMLDDETGYIRMTRFSALSAKEFSDALEGLQKQGMKSLIFDLRGNSGGYMNIAIEIVEQFLPAGKRILYTEGIRSPKQEFYAGGTGKFIEGNLIVLIDEGSASSSEIVSGALQDWDRALLIGRRSYGKGLVQKIYFLPDGSNVRLTTARYYTPSGRCIQRPFNEGTEKYFKEMNRRLKHGELVNADSIHFPDSLKYSTQAGRTVYGGGGIMPDIFMAVDSTLAKGLYNELVRVGVMNDYCIDYFGKNRALLKRQFKEPLDFISAFEVDSMMQRSFIEFTKSKNVTFEAGEFARFQPQINNQIKALIGRSLFGMMVYNRLVTADDPVIKRAREAISHKEEFNRLSTK